MRGLSTVAAFAVFLVIMVAFMIAVLYYFRSLGQTALQAVQQVRQAASLLDQQAALGYNGSCIFSAGPGSPFVYYLASSYSSGAAVYWSKVSPASAGAFKIPCPPSPGMYKYVGIRQNGQLAYLYVYVGPSSAYVVANTTVAYVGKVGDSVSAYLYLNAYNNSTGWLPVSYSVTLLYNASQVSCSPSTLQTGPLALEPGEQRPVPLGPVKCTAVGSFYTSEIKAVVTQIYGSYSWSYPATFVMALVNTTALASATTTTAPPSSACSFTASNGSKLSGFNQLNGWIGAWGPVSNGVVVALRPGLLVPDSTGAGTGTYYVQLSDIPLGTLVLTSQSTVGVSGNMPSFMSSVLIYASNGTAEVVLYSNGSAQATLSPGTYTIYGTFRASANAAPGSTATLYLTCGSSQYPIGLEIPGWDWWGIRADVYSNPNPYQSPIDNPSALGQYKGTWSIGAVAMWLGASGAPIPSSSPYFTIANVLNSAPQWVAAILNPSASQWVNWALNISGTLYIPWAGDVRVGVWHSGGAVVVMCGNSMDYWSITSPTFNSYNINCGPPGNKDVKIYYFEGTGEVALIFVVSHGSSGYIPTIDGAWRCINFNWNTGTCNTAWQFQAASSSVPYWVVSHYSPGTSDGRGTPSP